MRKLVAGALIVPFALACSPSRTQDFKGEPRKEGIMTDVRMALPSPLRQIYVFENGYTLWEDRRESIAIRNDGGELMFSGRLLKRIGSGRIIFKSENGGTFQTEKDGNILMCPENIPDAPLRNRNIR